MASIGNSPTQQAFTPAVDFFSGNGSTTAFTLSRPVASVAQVQVTIDNVAQNPSSAYTVSANTITFTSAPLSGTNNIYVYYTSPITQVIAPGQGTVNTTALGNITNIASGNSSLTLQTGSGNTTAVTVDTSQNVGIGNTTPSSYNNNAYKLVIGSNSAVTGMTLASGTSAAGNIFFARGTSGTDAYDGYVQYVQGSQYMAFGTNGGTERMRIDSSGNLLVGTTSNPTSLKIVASGTDNNNLIGSYNTASGNAGIRIQANQAGLYLQGSGTVDPLYITNSSSTGYIVFRPGSDTERVRLVANGTFMVGTTSETPAGSGDTKGISLNNSATSSQIYSTGNNDTCAVFNRAGSDGATVRLRRQGSDVGSISVTGSATAYNTSSDYRLKENITPMTGALAKVALLKPVTYKWKVDGSDGEGFIAHELAEVCPHAVVGDKDATREEEYKVTPAVEDEEGNITTPAVMGTRTVPSYQGVDTSFLVATLTAAIQELSAKNDALTARIEALENK